MVFTTVSTSLPNREAWCPGMYVPGTSPEPLKNSPLRNLPFLRSKFAWAAGGTAHEQPGSSLHEFLLTSGAGWHAASAFIDLLKTSPRPQYPVWYREQSVTGQNSLTFVKLIKIFHEQIPSCLNIYFFKCHKWVLITCWRAEANSTCQTQILEQAKAATLVIYHF